MIPVVKFAPVPTHNVSDEGLPNAIACFGVVLRQIEALSPAKLTRKKIDVFSLGLAFRDNINVDVCDLAAPVLSLAPKPVEPLNAASAIDVGIPTRHAKLSFDIMSAGGSLQCGQPSFDTFRGSINGLER